MKKTVFLILLFSILKINAQYLDPVIYSEQISEERAKIQNAGYNSVTVRFINYDKAFEKNISDVLYQVINYDGYGREIRREMYDESGKLDNFYTFKYDENGLISGYFVNSTKSNYTITYFYDENNRIIEKKTSKDGSKDFDESFLYAYDDFGRLKVAGESNWMTHSFEYDDFGRVIGKLEWNTYSAIEYDENGRESAVSLSENGDTFIEHNYYDANNRIEAKTGGNMFGLYRSEFEYDDFGNVTKNTHSVWEYDENGEPEMFEKCYIFLYLYE